MKRGLFISFEGTDGCGKSTQITLLGDALAARGMTPVITREPGGTSVGELIRGIILNPAHTEISGAAEMLLYAASRAQHVDEIIRPGLAAGRIVISDRFVDSSIAYQGGARGLGRAVQEVNAYAVRDCMPDLTFLLHADPAAVFTRVKKGAEDRIEAEGIALQCKVAEAYLQLAKEHPSRIMVIDALGSIEAVHAEIRERVMALLAERGGGQ